MKRPLPHVAGAAIALAFSAIPAGAQPVCAPLSWTTLGTAAGPVPTADRGEPANLLIAGDQFILVDAGDGTANALARTGVDLGSVRTAFISHHHMDHTGGLAAVIGLRWMNEYPAPLTVYGPPGTAELVAGIVASMAPQARVGFGTGAVPPSPSASVKVIEVRDGSRIALGPLTVTAAANSHYDRGGAGDPGGAQSLSYRFDVAGRSITYTGDTGPSAAVTRLSQRSDLLVSEVIDVERLISEIQKRRADAPPQMLAAMRQHLSTHHLPAAEVGRIASAARVGRVVLTHFAIPGPLDQSAAALTAGVRTGYAGPIALARDGDRFDVGCPTRGSR